MEEAEGSRVMEQAQAGEDREGKVNDYKPEDLGRRVRGGTQGVFAARAELFHQMLMEDFRFMEAARMQSGEYEGATLNTEDLKPMNKLKELMITNPQGLINFASYGTKGELMDLIKRRKNTVTNDFRTRRFITRMSKYPPWNIFAHYILSTRWFQVTMITVIVLNSFMMAVDGELDTDKTSAAVRQTIDSLDFFFLSMFITEIFMKWIDGFRNYWTDYWNIFDFLVSAASMVAPILDLVTQGADDDDRLTRILEVVKYIRIFRIFRSLNVVTRIRKIMVIWAAITRTFRSLLFITILMAIFFYIFSIIGIQLFDRFTKTHLELQQEQYPHCFANLPMAMLSLFQLFTLDKWHGMLYSLGDVSDSMFTPCLFVLLWILLGSFIFRNIFVGVMVNNFQNIRLELMEEQENAQGTNKPKLSNELNIFGLDDLENSILNLPPDNITDFEVNIFHNLEIIKTAGDTMSPILWPRDTLFQYFILLEAISLNMDERDKLMQLCNDALCRVFDEN